MEDLKPIQLKLWDLYKTVESKEDEYHRSMNQLQRMIDLKEQRDREGTERDSAELAKEIEESKILVNEKHKTFVLSKKNLAEALKTHLNQPHPKNLVTQLDDKIPFLLMPVRIETRFMTVQGNNKELWIRIFPDDIAVHTHEKNLTEDEVSAGETFWEEMLKASDDTDKQKGAWRVLATEYGSQRAAWISKEMKPLNWTEDPKKLLALQTLKFPAQTDIKQHSWSRAPRSKVMPDRFVVMGYSNGTEIFREAGELIPNPLILGPDPTQMDKEFEQTAGKLKLSGEIAWFMDFDQAVKKGMGFRISIDPKYSKKGFDRLLVLGLRLSSDENQCQLLFEELIENHHYSEGGFSLLKQGTPTNNTEESGSGYSSIDPGEESSFAVEAGKPLFSDTKFNLYKRDGQWLAEALGIETKTFEHVGNADSTDVTEAMCMNIALWPATLGYFLETMMRPTFSPETRKKCRGFFTDFITGRGSIPAIRVGKQPYGILPASVLSKWEWSKTHKGEEEDEKFLTELFNIIQKIDTQWEELSLEVAHAGAKGDSFKNLLEILGLHSSSAEFYQRKAVGPGVPLNYTKLGFGEAFLILCFDAMKKMGKKLMNQLGYTFSKPPYIFTLTYSIFHNLLNGPLIDKNPLSETKPIKPYRKQPDWNYIHWLRHSEVETIKDQDFGQKGSIKAPKSVLYMMLRHALLMEYWDASIQIHINNGKATESERKEFEFINIDKINQSTKWDYLEADANQITGMWWGKDKTIADVLYTHAGLFPGETKNLNKILNALDRLADIPTARLERILAEHLDLCSYRLDAWQTGIINRRLQTLRYTHTNNPNLGSRKKGIYLGAFGILENLRPRKEPKEVKKGIDKNLTNVVDGPILEKPDNGGFIHGPSLNHAVTAAILRNAYLTHADQKNAAVMSINLSSERVRIALSLLEGIRNGQELSALLGYHFERGLHDHYPKLYMDQYILTIRKKFPLVADKITDSNKNEPIEALEARNVVDGLALIKAARLNDKIPKENYPFGIKELPSLIFNKKKAKAIIKEIDRITNYLDGLGDLALSEGVFQVAQGNYDRAGAMLKAISEGSNIPDPEIIRTPRSGNALTSRVAIFLKEGTEYSDFIEEFWPLSTSPRSEMEPGLNGWIGTILGDPDKIRCQVSIKNSSSESGEISLKDLNIQPIDFIYMIGDELADETTELENRIQHIYIKKNKLSKDPDISIKFLKRKTSWSKQIKTFFEVLPLARRLKELVTECRHLNAEDLLLPNEKNNDDVKNPKGYDAVELEERVKKAIQSLSDTINQFEIATNKLKQNESKANIDFLRAVLIKAANFDLSVAFPSSTTGISKTELDPLMVQKNSAETALNKKLTEAKNHFKYASGLASTDENSEEKKEKCVMAAKAIFGESFNVIPVFKLRNSKELNIAMNHSGSMIKQLPKLIVKEWIQSFSRIRPKMEALEETISFIDIFEHKNLNLIPVQLPFNKQAGWAGVKYTEKMKEMGEILSIVLHKPEKFDPAEKTGGLLIDEWVESIPNQQETTGIAIHFNQPNSEPPQTLLLAVPPQLTGHWQWDDLVDTIHETLDRAKKRAVEPDQFLKSPYAHILPGIMPAISKKMVTISTDLSKNIEKKQTLP